MARSKNGKGNGNRRSREPLDFVNYVVGVDFGEPGDHAFWHAMNLGKRQKAVVIHVIHVVDGRGSVAGQEDELARAGEELEAYVRDYGAGIPGPYDPKVVAHVGMGNVARAMLQLAVDVSADLIIVGATPRGRGLRNLLHGSTADALLRAGRAPVLVAYPKALASAHESDQIEPACPECLKTQQSTAGAQLWCEEHSRPRVTPHVWGPTEANRSVTHDSEVSATGTQMIAGQGDGE